MLNSPSARPTLLIITTTYLMLDSTLASKSPSTYDEIRYDEQHQSGFLILPSRRRLRDHKNDIRPQQGFNAKVINELSCVVKHFTNQEKYVVILMDEMKIQEDLVWDKHTGDLIGYVDLGNTELNYAEEV